MPNSDLGRSKPLKTPVSRRTPVRDTASEPNLKRSPKDSNWNKFSSAASTPRGSSSLFDDSPLKKRSQTRTPGSIPRKIFRKHADIIEDSDDEMPDLDCQTPVYSRQATPKVQHSLSARQSKTTQHLEEDFLNPEEDSDLKEENSNLEGDFPGREEDQDINDDSESAPTPVKRTIKHQEDLRKCHQDLRRELEKPISSKDKSGYIYIAEDSSRPHIRKIGRSGDPPSRMKMINASCDHDAKLVYSKEVSFCAKTEALIKTELGNFKYKHKCKCGKIHREWFEVSEHTCRKVLSKWVAFMQNSAPYNTSSDMELAPFWKNRIPMYQPQFENEDLTANSFEEIWTQILNPPLLDQLVFHGGNTVASVRKSFFPFSAAFAWFLVWFTFPEHGLWTTSMVLHAVCAFVCLFQDTSSVWVLENLVESPKKGKQEFPIYALLNTVGR